MKYSTNKDGNLVLTFTSDINRDNGTTNEHQGVFESTMELFIDDDGEPTLIEWDIPAMEETEHIGLVFDGKDLEDYDGVFELPKEAIALIRKAGFRVDKHFEE